MKNSKLKINNILHKLVSLLDSDKYRQKFLGATDIVRLCSFATGPIMLTTFWMLHDPANGYLSLATLGNGVISYMAGAFGALSCMAITEIPFIKRLIIDKYLTDGLQDAFPNKVIFCDEARSLVKLYENFCEENKEIIQNFLFDMEAACNLNFAQYLRENDEEHMLHLLNYLADVQDYNVSAPDLIRSEVINSLEESKNKPLLFLKNIDSNNLDQAVISNEQPNDLIQKNVVNKIN